ncbi:hypothetical protein CERSUDRAFT_113375 [Gelatoporia subvermispora B]|uniref:Mitochondrial import inner membrane translocase subunit TIM54 n=1 Tax=Ceriporiopsis subvermispora (strain B) TaxID=914234 RepID=M2PP31_CERS8|nr:hypothetical protein CERSUDRAFT_113375 [Gelatoporia subvermispora B]
MSSNVGDSAFPEPKPPQSGLKAALQYTGIPPSWLDKRPKLPSRNWLIFLGVTSVITGCYVYDRRQCRKIKEEYVGKVKHLSEDPLHSLDKPRKVTVYGAKWPGDEDYDRSMLYFRKYVKPYLVAAAIDYEMIKGRRHGDLAERIANEIKSQRRQALGLDPPPPSVMLLPPVSPEEKRRRELEGGIIIVGRPTFKEFMAGVKRGWTESLEVVDKEEKLSRELETDGRFDEPELESPLGSFDDGEPIPTPSRLPSSKSFSPYTPPHLRNTESPQPRSSSSSESSIPDSMNAPPPVIPQLPPILLVHFVNYLGLTQIPLMIWDFFNERRKVRSGAEAAYRLIMGQTRPFEAPLLHEQPTTFDANAVLEPPKPYLSELSPSDLDFDKEAESYYKKSMVRDFESDITKARERFYKELPQRLDTARALARGTREPTKDERDYPPPTEVELRAERMKKELRWTSDEHGWRIVTPNKDPEWDERLREALKVFIDP